MYHIYIYIYIYVYIAIALATATALAIGIAIAVAIAIAHCFGNLEPGTAWAGADPHHGWCQVASFPHAEPPLAQKQPATGRKFPPP